MNSYWDQFFLRHLFLTFFLFFVTIAIAHASIDDSYSPTGWIETKGDHFVVLCATQEDEEWARDILNHAESYYNDIADDIGYVRYQNFWTWEKRVKIVLFRSQESYVQQTGQPAWSNGYANVYSEMFKSRIIVSYKGQPDFLEVILPHEITHLILHDFINRPFPRFFDEGVAQLEQKDESLNHKDVVSRLITEGKGLAVQDLLNYDLGAHKSDAKAVAIFYIESLYIVDFLIKTYGKDSFKELCRHLRDGDNFEQALKAAYYPSLDSIQMLQDKWFDYAKQ